MIPIRNHGRLLKTDGDGFLIGDADAAHIRPPWRAAVDFASQAILDHLGAAVHSVYIRGSVPRGLAVEGLSDIDTYFVVHGEAEACHQLDLSWKDAVRAEFARRFPFAQGMELMCIALARAIEDERKNFGLRLLIKVESLCLHGEDVGQRLAPITLDQVIAMKGASLADDLAAFQAALESEEEIEERCRWLMKRFLRQGMRLVMAQERAYTRDLYPAYACFAKHYPQQQTAMRQALEWALNPTSDLRELSAFAQTLGEWFLEAEESAG